MIHRVRREQEEKEAATRVLGRPPRNVGCSVGSARRDEGRSTIIDASIQLAQKVIFVPWDWYLALNALRYQHWLSSKEGRRLIYVMGNHPYPPARTG